jgi:hypothetical protein
MRDSKYEQTIRMAREAMEDVDQATTPWAKRRHMRRAEMYLDIASTVSRMSLARATEDLVREMGNDRSWEGRYEQVVTENERLAGLLGKVLEADAKRREYDDYDDYYKEFGS